MKKNTLNYIVDIVTFLLMMAIIGIGFLMKFVLITIQEAGYSQLHREGQHIKPDTSLIISADDFLLPEVKPAEIYECGPGIEAAPHQKRIQREEMKAEIEVKGIQ